jgi:tetratricopeptide (TPR) repeat protein
VSKQGYTQDVADFLEDGSCKSLEGGNRRFCSWSARPGGAIEIRYGDEDKGSPLRAEIDGDRMQLTRDGRPESSWVRMGSEMDKSMASYTKGLALVQAGDYAQGVVALKEAADRDFSDAQNSLAWVYATARDPKFQDGKQAVAYAEKAVAQSRQYPYLDTLAAALARDGQFKKAADTETEALGKLEVDTHLPGAERQAAIGRFRQRIELYQGGQAYTEP